MARDNIVALFDHDSFEEMEAYKEAHPNSLAEKADVAFQGNGKLVSSCYEIYDDLLDFWAESNPDFLYAYA